MAAAAADLLGDVVGEGEGAQASGRQAVKQTLLCPLKHNGQGQCWKSSSKEKMRTLSLSPLGFSLPVPPSLCEVCLILSLK